MLFPAYPISLTLTQTSPKNSEEGGGHGRLAPPKPTYALGTFLYIG